MAVFCFTDIEGSTEKWETHREVMGSIISRHYEILDRNIARFGGEIIKRTGDGIFALFTRGEPLAFAIEAQKEIQNAAWDGIGELRVRMALHTGDAELISGDYYGPVANRTARLMSAAWGGQIVVSAELRALAPSVPAGASFQDLGVHLLKDLNQPQHISGLLHPDLKLNSFPPLRSLSSHPNNLPSQPTPFVGREGELAEIRRLLADPGCRLLTLVGPGGMGKTRLALQAAAEQVEHFKHGAYFVALAGIGTSSLLASTLAEALKFTPQARSDEKKMAAEEDASQDHDETLIEFLRDRQVLLILDNFEHVLEGTGLVSRILEKTSLVKILATSREILNVKGEWAFEVEGLKNSGSGVDLFLQGARRAQANIKVSERDHPTIAKICSFVQGMPLGIELASAWVRTMSVEEIAAEMEKTPDFLATHWRDVPERHRSLGAVFEYSWKLLSKPEAEAFKRASVFRGTFSRAALEKVSGASPGLLAALVDKSLVKKGGEGRYQIHEFIRQHAEKKLEKDGEGEGTRDLHAAYFAEMFHESEKDDAEPFLARIDLDKDNFWQAWNWSLARGNRIVTGKLVESMWKLCKFRNLRKEGHETFSMARDMIGSLTPTDGGMLLGKILVFGGGFHGSIQEGTANIRSGLEILRKSGVQPEIARALIMLSEQFFNGMERDLLLLEALEISEKIDKPILKCWCMTELGLNQMWNEKFSDAEKYFRESIHLAKKIGDMFGKARTSWLLAMVCRELGKNEESEVLLSQCQDYYEKLGGNQGKGEFLMQRADNAEAMGDQEKAARFYEEALEFTRSTGRQGNERIGLLNFMDYWRRQGDPEKAKILYQQYLAIPQERDSRFAIHLYRASHGARRRGEYEEAEFLGRQALESSLAHEEGHHQVAFWALMMLCDLSLVFRDVDKAERYLSQGLALCDKDHDRKDWAWYLEQSGKVAWRKNQHADAIRLVTEGLELNRNLEQKTSQVNCLILLGRISASMEDYGPSRKYLLEALTWLVDLNRNDKIDSRLGCLEAVAELLFRSGSRDQALQLASYCISHPDCSEEWKKEVTILIGKPEFDKLPVMPRSEAIKAFKGMHEILTQATSMLNA